jgi:hypothetical protein
VKQATVCRCGHTHTHTHTHTYIHTCIHTLDASLIRAFFLGDAQFWTIFETIFSYSLYSMREAGVICTVTKLRAGWSGLHIPAPNCIDRPWWPPDPSTPCTPRTCSGPSKGGRVKNLYTKSARLTIIFRVTGVWSERVDCCSRQIMELLRETKTYAT